MRLVGWLLLVVVCLVWLVRELPVSNSPESAEGAVPWRRTSHGWERLATETPLQPESRPPTLHPLVVGAFQLLLVLTAMVAFSSARKPRRRQTAPHPASLRRSPARGGYRFMQMRQRVSR